MHSCVCSTGVVHVSYSLSRICSYHSGVNVGEIVACSSAPASASHLCTVGCQIISVHSSSMNATGLNFLLIVSLLWVYPRWILLASAIFVLSLTWLLSVSCTYGMRFLSPHSRQLRGIRYGSSWSLLGKFYSNEFPYYRV